MGEDRRVALSTDGKQRFINAGGWMVVGNSIRM